MRECKRSPREPTFAAVTVTDPTATGYLRVAPGTSGAAGTINYSTGVSVNDVVVVPVDEDGRFTLWSSWIMEKLRLSPSQHRSMDGLFGDVRCAHECIWRQLHDRMVVPLAGPDRSGH